MWRLQKCCCFLGLRKGCILIAILDFFTNVLVLNFAETKFIGHIEQAVAICHCIGCLFLLGGALIKSTVLLMFFLITSLTNYIILSVYCVTILIWHQKYAKLTATLSTVYVCFGVYFWIVVYSFLIQIRTPPVGHEV
ncbi:uncharacterized protein Dana_GF28154, isoform A [Drosophila ananassae]|uniref:Uncharacterized protein, isoform A n=1 Tax=Drosophila ananassae TaxID=7217 RepID=A0A0P8YBJ2_DROAN|nr:uncharacterized protein LOC26515563 isoform X1 [Drosophila ananassae]KAH8316282.1 hypothetical protein KR067_004189 [Drosophila pandora]KPU76385.1 uncharacterized protein Dana_GF28154, isoform A [Drosophila ananassae]